MEVLLERSVDVQSSELRPLEAAPLVLPVSEFLTEEYEAQQQAAALIQSVGDVALRTIIEKPSSIDSLHDAIHRAATGDNEARALIEMNARTDVTERTIKAGHVSQVTSEVDADGKIRQHGQYLDDVHRNALRFVSEHPIIRKRTEAEIRNGKRIEQLNKAGILDEYYFVVVSRCEEGMSDAQLDEIGFFSETKSCALQITDNQNGSIVTESAFVAGVKRPSTERHDQKTVIDLGDTLGADWHDMSPAQIIDAPILVHKSVFKNGVIDLVQLYDQVAGRTFFGEDKPARDYLEYKQLCKERQRSFEPQVAQITRQLINEAGTIHSPVAAFKRLAKLSQDAMVERAIVDEAINPRVFGLEAAAAINQARWYHEQGQFEQANGYVQKALATADSNSCPSAVSSSELDTEGISSKSKEELSWHGGAIKKGTCVNCNEGPKDVGVKSWCKDCIKGHCG